MSFPFEKLDVYRKSLSFIDKIENLNSAIRGKISFSFRDQISRASSSIALNIAEGNGRWSGSDKAHFFRIARGSAFEVVPLVQIFYQRKLLTESLYKELYNDLLNISKMLTGLIKSTELR